MTFVVATPGLSARNVKPDALTVDMDARADSSSREPLKCLFGVSRTLLCPQHPARSPAVVMGTQADTAATTVSHLPSHPPLPQASTVCGENPRRVMVGNARWVHH